MIQPLHPLEGVVVMDGLVIAGTRPGCGKTVAATGIAAAMIQDGLRVQAIKPIDFSPPNVIRKSADYAFMLEVQRPLQVPDQVVASCAYEVGGAEWGRVVHICRSMALPCLIEGVGSVATPLAYVQGRFKDITDLALELDLRLLLVTSYSGRLIEEMVPALAYLKQRKVPVLGWLVVETEPPSRVRAPNWDAECLAISHEYHLPCLGTLPYSPSIHVATGQQGNLIRQTEVGIDLLPIQMGLSVAVP